MMTIWKEVLRPTDVQEIEMPIGSQVLCVREQFETICIWFRCDPSLGRERRRFEMAGTGHPIPVGLGSTYLGTVSLKGGALILHVFEHVRATT